MMILQRNRQRQSKKGKKEESRKNLLQKKFIKKPFKLRKLWREWAN